MQRLLLFTFLIILFAGLESCFLSEIMGSGKGIFVKDTVVAVENMKTIDVQYVQSDSSYALITYWTDAGGRPLFKKRIQNFTRQIKDGPEKHWDENGQLIYNALWSKGTPLGAITEYYGNGQLKKKIEFDDKKGYARFEMNFHENGRIKSDTIMYYKGKKEGEVNYYDENSGEITEKYIYARDSLLSIKIFKKEYELLAKRADELKNSVKRDSVDRIKKDSLFSTLLGNLQAMSPSNWSNEDNKKERIEYLETLLKSQGK